MSNPHRESAAGLRLSIIVCAAYATILLSGLKRFTIWQQIWDVHGSQAVDLFKHPHGLRYFLIWPLIRLSEALHLSPDVVFTAAVGSIVLMTGIIVGRASQVAVRETLPLSRAWILGFFAALSLFMNGRIAFAMLGVSILLWSMLRSRTERIRPIRELVVTFAALWLSAVSSGTLMIAIGFVILRMGLELLAGATRLVQGRLPGREVSYVSVLAAVAALGSPILWMLIRKNLDYYGGGSDGFVRMLEHGVGVFFHRAGENALFLFLAVILIGGIATVLSMHMRPAYRLPLLSALIGLTGGAFGFSTLTMIIPSLVVLVVLVSREVRGISRAEASV